MTTIIITTIIFYAFTSKPANGRTRRNRRLSPFDIHLQNRKKIGL